MKNFVTAVRVVERLAGLTSIARIKEFCDVKAAGVRNWVRPDCIFFSRQREKSMSSTQNFYRVKKIVSVRLITRGRREL